MKAEAKGKNTIEQAIENRTEIDLLESRQATKEGMEAHTQIRQIETKEEMRLRAISDEYLGGVPYERDRVIGEVRAYMQQTVSGIIEAGRRLIALKEAEKHGDWIPLVEETLGISRVTAWRLMAIAQKFAKCFNVKHLQFGSGGLSKLYALLSVPDEELAEFDETGLFRGATREALDKMTLPQLKKLIAEKEDWKVKAEQLQLEASGRYDTVGRLKKGNEKLQKENERLKRELVDAKRGLPEDTRLLADVLEGYRTTCMAIHDDLIKASPGTDDQIGREILFNAASFFYNVFDALRNQLNRRFDVPQRLPDGVVEEQEKQLQGQYDRPLRTEGGSIHKVS